MLWHDSVGMDHPVYARHIIARTDLVHSHFFQADHKFLQYFPFYTCYFLFEQWNKIQIYHIIKIVEWK